MISPAPTTAEAKKRNREKSHPGESLQPAAKKVKTAVKNEIVDVAGENKKPIVDAVVKNEEAAENEVAKAVPVAAAEIVVDDEGELAEIAAARSALQGVKERLMGLTANHAVRAELRRLGFPEV